MVFLSKVKINEIIIVNILKELLNSTVKGKTIKNKSNKLPNFLIYHFFLLNNNFEKDIIVEIINGIIKPN